jgi:hypothetical protein
MPTYQNVSTVPVSFNGKVIEPGKEVCSFSYFDENTIKLLKVSDKPYYNPIIISGVTNEKSDLIIPEKDELGVSITKYAIHFYVEHGEVDIYFNNRENKPCLLLYAGAKWNMRCFERQINKICVNGGKNPFRVWVIVEKLS